MSSVFNWRPWIITFLTALIGIDNGNTAEIGFRTYLILSNGQKIPKINLKLLNEQYFNLLKMYHS